ncbi:MAG: hypothetical protein NTZ83_02600 [Candidatus Pacearchaeota archaeon]|nr:hypothetical protein [Candidatus Pacearchaeota archaeon]
MNKKIIFPVVVLAILLVSTVSVGATQNANTNNNNNFDYTILAYHNIISLIIENHCNESLNYSFKLIYGNLLIPTRRQDSKIIFEDGTVDANSELLNIYKVKFSFSSIIVFLQIDNSSCFCFGFVFGKHVIFKSISVGSST